MERCRPWAESSWFFAESEKENRIKLRLIIYDVKSLEMLKKSYFCRYNCLPITKKPCGDDDWTKANCPSNHICLVDSTGKTDCDTCQKGFEMINNRCTGETFVDTYVKSWEQNARVWNFWSRCADERRGVNLDDFSIPASGGLQKSETFWRPTEI